MSNHKPRKATTAQPKFTMLVANLKAGSDPSKGTPGNPVKARSTYTQQYLLEVPGKGGIQGAGTLDPHRPGLGSRHAVLLAGTPTASAFTITVDDNDFTSPATIYLGGYAITSGEHFTVGGTTDLTAAAIAAAINALPGYTAPAPGGSVVVVAGPKGPEGNAVLFEALYGGSVQNYTLAPADGSGDGAEPLIGPPVLT